MRILYTDSINASTLSNRDKLYLYNGLDCLLCREIFDNISPMLDPTTQLTYNFMRALQAPVLEMQLRGVLIDKQERCKKIKLVETQLSKIEQILNTYAEATWGKPLNARSWQQKATYLYDFARCTEIRKFDYKKGVSKRTTEREAIEKLHAKYLNIRPVASCILAIMDLSKQLGTLKGKVDADGYFRSSFNIAGTETGRFSSKKNCFSTGSNFQNWAEQLRSIFTAILGRIPNRKSYNIPEEFR